MAAINPSTLDSIFQGFKTIFADAYASMPVKTFWERVATRETSTTRTEEYPMPARVPKMREWLGNRKLNNVATYNYELTNRDWELTLEVDRNDIEDDRIGLYRRHIEMLAFQARKLPDHRIAEAIKEGDAQKCHDGQNFFSTTHPVNLYDNSFGAQSNLLTSLPLTPANYAIARETFQLFKSEDGEPMGLMPDLLMVPPQLEEEARIVLNAEQIAVEITSGSTAAPRTNVYRGSAELLVVPELSADSGVWYLLCTQFPVKPFIWQERKAPEFVFKTNSTDDNVFDLKKYRYGVDARGVEGYGPWWLALRCEA